MKPIVVFVQSTREGKLRSELRHVAHAWLDVESKEKEESRTTPRFPPWAIPRIEVSFKKEHRKRRLDNGISLFSLAHIEFGVPNEKEMPNSLTKTLVYFMWSGQEEKLEEGSKSMVTAMTLRVRCISYIERVTCDAAIWAQNW